MSQSVRFCYVSLLFASAVVEARSLEAGFMTFTDRASFDAALPAPSATLTFDSLPAGTLICEGETVEGITFNYDLLTNLGVSMQVLGEFDTTSPPNYLGTDDGGVFQDGDSFDLAFAPSFAVGLTLISADQLLDNDFMLIVGGTSVGLDASAVQEMLLNGDAYFLGIINDETPFTSASLVADGGPGGPFFLYNVDDITTAPAAAKVVPEPASLWLLGIGAGCLMLLVRVSCLNHQQSAAPATPQVRD